MSRSVKVMLVAIMAMSWSLLPARGQTNYYVATNGVDSRAGTNWDTALLTISNALARTVASGDTILVSNGTYALTATNLIITNGVVLRSLNGATNTIIKRTGASSYRIMYISNVNAVVDGFTITNGDYGSGGGVFIDVFGTISNCIVTGNSCAQNANGGGIYLKKGGYVANCRIVGNSTSHNNYYGAGIYIESSGTVVNCEISGNQGWGSGSGGGVYLSGSGILRNCLIVSNAYYTSFTHQYWQSAGGVHCEAGGVVENCTIIGNYCQAVGGLMCKGGGTILNSIIYGNTATAGGTLNCSNSGTGWSYTNCCTIPAVAGVSNITADPQLTDPAAGNLRLLPGSPCIDTGANRDWMTNALDLDGNARILNTNVDLGAYEYKIGALSCSPNGDPVAGLASNNVVFTAAVAGTNTVGLYYMWDFQNDATKVLEGADKQIVSNLYMPGLYSVRLVVTNTIGESATCVRTNYIKVGPAIAYVDTNATPVYPYTNWTGAATNIQAAIDAGVDGTRVLVTNGLYLITNQINLVKGVVVQSVSGASNTVVKRTGSAASRIFFISHSNAVVDGFTITNGYGPVSRNNIYGETGCGVTIDAGGTVSNCLITGNYCLAGGNMYGGGVFITINGLVRNCRIIGNRVAAFSGGGVYLNSGGLVENCEMGSNWCAGSGSGGGAYLLGGGILRNCLVYDNTHGNPNLTGQYSFTAGGVHCNRGTVENCTIVSNYCVTVGGLTCTNGGTILNSIIYLNKATNNTIVNYTNGGSWSYTNCCTTPAVAGDGNITADPLFVDTNSANYRLARASSCVNAGTNQSWMLPFDGGAIDLDGKRRIFFGRVDLGAYEVPAPKGTILGTW